jgi:hypothetical protein
MAHIQNDGYIHSLIMMGKYPQTDELNSLLHFFVGYEFHREDAKFIIKFNLRVSQTYNNPV